MDLLFARFGYCFQTPAGSDYPPILTAHLIEPDMPVEIDGAGGAITFRHFPLRHGNIDALGFRIDDFAYTPDVSEIPPECIDNLAGLDCWVIDALRDTPHPTHFSLSEALGWIERLKPRRAILTNLHTDLDYNRLVGELPEKIVPAYDGMRFDIR